VDLVGVHANDASECDATGGEDEDRCAVIDVAQGPSLQAGGQVAKVDDLDVFVRFLAGVDGVWVLDRDGAALGDGVRVGFCVEVGMAVDEGIGVGVSVEVGSGVAVGPAPVVVGGRVGEAAASADASA
jgi:hypothetical protein